VAVHIECANFLILALAYSIISPIINGLSCFAFFLFYLLYKDFFLYRYTQEPSADTGGLFFPKAIQHVFVGMYIQQICLCTLFLLAQNDSKPSAIPEAALMIILIAITAFYHTVINDSFGPLVRALSLSHVGGTFRHPEPSVEPHGVHARSHPKRKETIDSGFAPSPIDKPCASSSSGSGIEHTPESDHDNIFFARTPDGEEDYGFAHPAVSRPQRVVWIPDDSLNLGREEVQANREAGIKATTLNAVMDENGKVNVTGPPVDLLKF
jgi:hypothetical protein